ncbi:hypothetical protein PR202_gn00541 [Eleusine coracana subsp. coracana]|uniref:Uncharacterized protein n=1 Tax=Eleusine coracana subsp. coracana TaxID=191504 RepID=A0AAV5G2H4_ELECO|nr:hypothetical protein PR202_gn00541 [Eleusine coracana subsp. coracana]
MSSAAAPSSTFLLALASASTAGRRRAGAGSSPPFRGVGASLNFRFWAPPRAPRNAAVVRAETGPGSAAGGKDAAAPERRADGAKPPRARRGGAGGETVEKPNEPVQPAGRYGHAGTGDAESAPPPPPVPKQETATRFANGNGALKSGEDKSIVPATPLSIVKLSDVIILPSGDTAPGAVGSATPPAFSVQEKSVPKPQAPSPPVAAVQEATWDFKKYIGFDEPAEEKNDDAGSFEDDSGPLAGENVMNVVVVAAECSPWCKTGMGITASDFAPCCCSFQFA